MLKRFRPAALAALRHPDSARLHRLFAALQSGRSLTAQQAAQEFDVSRRTIARDLSFLREGLGLLIEYEAATKSYRLHGPEHVAGDGGSESHEALAAFLVAHHALTAIDESPDRDLLQSAAAQLGDALPATFRVEDTAVVAEGPASPPLAFESIVALHRAAEERRRVLVQAPSGDRTLVPRALLSRQGRWWAVCEEAGGFHFASLSGVTGVVDRGPEPSTAAALDLDALLDEHPLICAGAGHRVHCIELRGTDPELDPAPPFHHRIVERDEKTLLYICSDSALRVARWCLGMLPDFEAVDAPLRAAVHKRALAVAALHAGSPAEPA